MERRYYTAETLRAELDEFEERYGISSSDFAGARQLGVVPSEVDPFESLVWADTYRTWLRLR